MKVSFKNLNGQFECENRRRRVFNTDTEESSIKKFAVLQKKTIIDAIQMKISIGDIDRAIAEGIQNIEYKSEKQRELKKQDAIRRCKRFVEDVLDHIADRSEDHWTVATSLPAKTITITCGKEPVTVENVKPDIMIFYGDTIESYIIRVGKAVNKSGAAMTDVDLNKDKMLYALLKYTEEYVKPGEEKTCRAGYAFLRKRSDKMASRTTTPSFDLKFFVTDNGNRSDNIKFIEEKYANGTHITESDYTFGPLFDEFIDGIAMSECTEEQCKECPYDEICHYVHAPIKLPDLESVKTLDAISLSPTQEKIEQFKSGYALVNAVPGAGKTLVLVLRIINLLLNGVNPEDIVIITFTNSGAEVFKNRIAQYNEDVGTGKDVSKMIATTFNGLGQKILEKEYQSLGFTSAPRVIDPIERNAIIAKMTNAHNVDDLDYRNFTTDMVNCKGALAVASAVFQAIKTYGYSEFDADAIAKTVGKRFCSERAAGQLAQLYNEYDQYLKEKNLVEYADQEMMVLDILQKDPYYFDQFHWKHILVDECQDTSENQFKLLKYMSSSPTFESNMVVGDDSQSIYGFRGTSSKYFISFEEMMGLPAGTVQTFYMTENYRSTPEIVDFANQIVQKNIWKVVKDIQATNRPGSPVTVKGFIEQKEEYQYILEEIKKHIENGTAPESIAFIASTRTELMKMADLLTFEGIPSVMLNPERLLENSRVKAGIALAKVIQNPDDEKNLLIVLNACFGGELFSLTSEQIQSAIEMKRAEIQEIKQLPEDEMKEKVLALFDELDEDDEVYQSFVEKLQSLPSVSNILEYCGDFELYGEKAEKRCEKRYPGVVLTTAHSSKGMEWPIVFNSLTKYDTPDLHTGKSRDKEEEKRRLLFVSATRAREELYVTGTYVAYGPEKDRHYNMFLKESYDIVGKEFSIENITNEYQRRKSIREKEKMEKKAKEVQNLLKQEN